MKSIALSACVAAAFALCGCDGAKKEEAAVPAMPALTRLEIKDTKVGDGAVAAPGDMVTVAYTGRFMDGTEFDSSEDEDGRPLVFVIGQHGVIQGWQEGIPGMKVGGEREIKIPSKLAYGVTGYPGQIPPNTDIQFSLKLLDVVKKGEEKVYDTTDLRVGQGRAVRKGDAIAVEYTGRFVDGVEFDSNANGGSPLEFTVGNREVIVGMDDGVIGMKPGGVRKLRIPPNLAYGPNGRNEIPPNSTLVFEIKLLQIK